MGSTFYIIILAGGCDPVEKCESVPTPIHFCLNILSYSLKVSPHYPLPSFSSKFRSHHHQLCLSESLKSSLFLLKPSKTLIFSVIFSFLLFFFLCFAFQSFIIFYFLRIKDYTIILHLNFNDLYLNADESCEF